MKRYFIFCVAIASIGGLLSCEKGGRKRISQEGTRGCVIDWSDTGFIVRQEGNKIVVVSFIDNINSGKSGRVVHAFDDAEERSTFEFENGTIGAISSQRNIMYQGEMVYVEYDERGRITEINRAGNKGTIDPKQFMSDEE